MIRTRHFRNWGPTLLVTCLLVGCKNAPSEPPPDVTDGTSTESSGRLLRLDPALTVDGRVEVATAVTFERADDVTIPGEVVPAPDGEADVGSLVAGRIASLNAVEGAKVTKGQVLAWLDAPEVGGVRADLARATAQLSAAEQRLERQLTLQAQGATSQAAVNEARAAVASAQADQRGAQARLGAAGTSSSGTSGKVALRTPIDGVVVERRATLGGAVAPDTTVFRVINPDTLRVKARWSETLGSIPAVNTRVHLSPRASVSGGASATCDARVETHLGVIDPHTRSVTLQVAPAATCPPLTAGGYVDVFVSPETAPDQTRARWVAVPLEAVVDLRGLPTVFVAHSEPGVFEARTVDAKPSVGRMVPIELGLEAGEKVAVKGVVLLKGIALGDLLGGD